MATIAIIGDGPGGLSAALFLAKAGHDTHVFGTDGTVMNYAHLYNYLGIESISGTEFQQRARAQVAERGAVLVDAEVSGVTAMAPGFDVATEQPTLRSDYLVLREGKAAPLAMSLASNRTASGSSSIATGAPRCRAST